MKKVVLKYNDLIKIIQEQVNGEYYDITPEKYLELMELAGYNGKGLSRIKKFQGKPLRIIGDLNISGTPVKDLGNIAIVDGNLDISNTNVMSVDGIDIKGDVRDWNSGAHKARMRKIQLQKIADADNRRQEGEWSLNNEDIDEEGLRANAVYEYLVMDGTVEEMTDEDKIEINRLKSQISKLTNDYDDEDDPELVDAIYDQIGELEEELDDLMVNKADVYILYPEEYGNYGMTNFELLDGDGEYSVGTEEEMEKAALEQIENFIDDVGIDGFRSGYVDNYIDEDEVARWFEDMFYDDVRESPESYFDEDDFEFTEEQQNRIEQLENQINEHEEKQSNTEDSDEYDEYQNLIDELQEELDGIEIDTEPTEEMIENAVDSRLYDVRRHPASYIDDYGLDVKDFIDIDELIKGVYADDGYDGILTYDGAYEVVDIKGTDYYVFRTN